MTIAEIAYNRDAWKDRALLAERELHELKSQLEAHGPPPSKEEWRTLADENKVLFDKLVKSEAANAEMRTCLQIYYRAYGFDDAVLLKSALSSTAGTGWLSPEEAKAKDEEIAVLRCEVAKLKAPLSLSIAAIDSTTPVYVTMPFEKSKAIQAEAAALRRALECVEHLKSACLELSACPLCGSYKGQTHGTLCPIGIALSTTAGKELLEELEKTKSTLHQALLDQAEDDTAIRKAVSGLLTDYEINGDTFGVPSPPDIVDTLVKKLNATKAELTRTSLGWKEDSRILSDIRSSIPDDAPMEFDTQQFDTLLSAQVEWMAAELKERQQIIDSYERELGRLRDRLFQLGEGNPYLNK